MGYVGLRPLTRYPREAYKEGGMWEVVMDSIADAIESLEVAVVRGIVFFLVSSVAAVAFGWLIQQLIVLQSPWYIWLIAVIIIGGTLSTEIKEVLLGGLLFSGIVMYLAIEANDPYTLGVIVAAWGLFGLYEYLKFRYS